MIFIPVTHYGSWLRQEPVQIEKLIEYKGLHLGLHRGLGFSRNNNAIWIVSDILTGAKLSVSISEKLALKFAEKRIEKHGIEAYKSYQSKTLKRVIERTV